LDEIELARSSANGLVEEEELEATELDLSMSRLGHKGKYVKYNKSRPNRAEGDGM
jgi:hypothetical protein